MRTRGRSLTCSLARARDSLGLLKDEHAGAPPGSARGEGLEKGATEGAGAVSMAMALPSGRGPGACCGLCVERLDSLMICIGDGGQDGVPHSERPYHVAAGGKGPVQPAWTCSPESQRTWKRMELLEKSGLWLFNNPL